MKLTVPFVSGVDAARTEAWFVELNRVLPETVSLKRFDQLSEEARASAKVAVVVDPDPAEIALLPNLVWIQSLWAGVEQLVQTLPLSGPHIVRMTDPSLARSMSEAVLAWTLYLHRLMPQYRSQQVQKVWRQHLLKSPEAQTVGVLGLGHLGETSAQRLKHNGFHVLGWSRSNRHIEGIDTFCGRAGLTEILAASDILVVLVPLTPQTNHLIDASGLSECKPGVSLINFSRGQVIDEDALLAALDQGHVQHAVLDVFKREPLDPNHRFWTHPKVTVLPHISAPTQMDTASKVVAKNIHMYIENGEIPASVDRTRGY